jgi:hypothetical protein
MSEALLEKIYFLDRLGNRASLFSSADRNTLRFHASPLARRFAGTSSLEAKPYLPKVTQAGRDDATGLFIKETRSNSSHAKENRCLTMLGFGV